jgi:hypothetical protein
MKNFAAILSILSIVVTPCLAQDEAACVNETASLATNQAVTDAYQAMFDEVEAAVTANPLQFCDISSRTCTIDVGEYTSSLKTTCEAQGGQLVEREVNATCSGTVSGIPITGFEVATEGVPLCAGASCDPGALPDEVLNGLEGVVEEIVSGINLAFDGSLVCEFEIGSGSGGGGDTTPSPTPSGDGTSPTITPTAPGSGGGGGSGEETAVPTGEETAVPTGDGSETGTTPPPTPSGDGSAPTPTKPTSGAQAATVWVSATCLTLVSFIWM